MAQQSPCCHPRCRDRRVRAA